jgi:hypothetical protein
MRKLKYVKLFENFIFENKTEWENPEENLIIYQSGEMSHSYAYTKTSGDQAQKQWQARLNNLSKKFRESLNGSELKDKFLRLSSCSSVETFNLNGGHHGILIWRVIDGKGAPIYLNYNEECVDGWFVETPEQQYYNRNREVKFIKKEEFDMLVKKQMIEDPQDLESGLKKIGFLFRYPTD